MRDDSCFCQRNKKNCQKTGSGSVQDLQMRLEYNRKKQKPGAGFFPAPGFI